MSLRSNGGTARRAKGIPVGERWLELYTPQRHAPFEDLVVCDGVVARGKLETVRRRVDERVEVAVASLFQKL
jgi:hypothetical protein